MSILAQIASNNGVAERMLLLMAALGVIYIVRNTSKVLISIIFLLSLIFLIGSFVSVIIFLIATCFILMVFSKHRKAQDSSVEAQTFSATGSLPVTKQLNGFESNPTSTQAGGPMTYNVVPFSASVAHGQGAEALAAKLENLIAAKAAEGWEFVSIEQINTFQAGTNGCFTIGAQPPSTIETELVVFRK